MARKLFWEDAYLTQHRPTVSSVDGAEVRLEATIFFAFSGGQESDAGSIGGYAVEEARKDALDIIYRLHEDHTLKVGQAVDVVIDWPRRYSLMRLHFAAEMVLQLIYQHVPGITRIGAHISADKARIDFMHDTSLAGLLPTLLSETEALVLADLPIQTGYTDVALQRRYWKVEGFASMACGGTHPRTTGEIGVLSLKRKNPGKGKERIEIALAGLQPSP
ncbi:Alanine--tRNA ligase [Ralstonia flaminis]|jgi:alanyl-tRNA synthetase|uniref:Alanine--tRNA ligase n=1 Tax=Ralstonia flaminis TaxID=3058597 RepID=A0ABM9K1V0_9RALS|nr:Alanine--tRNA ligase [Ralstonia sp. LMG 18101]